MENEKLSQITQGSRGKLDFLRIIILGIVCLLVLIYLLTISYEIGYEDGQLYVGETQNAFVMVDYLVPSRHFAILIGLIGVAVGLWRQHIIGFICSIVGFIVIGATYIKWYVDTNKYINGLELTEYQIKTNPEIQNIGTFVNAKFLDKFTLTLMVVILLLYLTQVFITIKNSKKAFLKFTL